MAPLPKPDRYAKRESVDYRGLAHPKNPPEPDARFKDFARVRGCKTRGLTDTTTEAPHRCERFEGRLHIEFAHYRTAGKGLKGSDRGNGMGLCHVMHRLQHDLGWPRFAERFGIDPEEICAALADEYDRKFPTTK